jgi:hypothetical protein
LEFGAPPPARVRQLSSGKHDISARFPLLTFLKSFYWLVEFLERLDKLHEGTMIGHVGHKTRASAHANTFAEDMGEPAT